MSGVRRALLFASLERYVGLAVSFGAIAIVSRLLTPAEIGTAAIGTAVFSIALSLREFAACGFLIQHKEVSRADVRTAFTVQLGLTLLIGAVLSVVAPAIATFYGEPQLADFVRVMAAALVVETFAAPIVALLRRDLAFGALAVINVGTGCVSALVTILAAAAGLGFMCVAWASLASTSTTVALAFCFRPELDALRPTLESWRRAFAFGRYNGAMALLDKCYEGLPQLVLGRVMPLEMVGLYRRAITISSIADRFILAGVFSVAFPALAAELRAGRSLKEPLLKAFCYMTAFHWPALVLIALLAHPIVDLLLGQQWNAVVPLVQMMAVASLALFPVVLTQPLLLAVGAMRHAFLCNLIALPLAAFVLCGASTFGVEAMAASQFLTIPFQVFVSLSFIRRHVPFKWSEMASALRQSVVVTVCCALPVLSLIAVRGMDFRLSLGVAGLAAVLSLCGWVAGIRLAGHPVGAEVVRAADALGHRSGAVRLVGRWLTASAG